MKEKRICIINGVEFMINEFGTIIEEGGYIKYAVKFTEEELNALPPLPKYFDNRLSRQCVFFDTKAKEWVKNYTFDDFEFEDEDLKGY